MKITTRDELLDLFALALHIATGEGMTLRDALLKAIHMWAGLRIDVEADVRYLPTGETIRPHVSVAAGVPALELAYP